MLSQTVADARTLPGGGWPEMAMAQAVQTRAARTPGKRSLAMESFAAALRAIPATISENAGGLTFPQQLTSGTGASNVPSQCRSHADVRPCTCARRAPSVPSGHAPIQIIVAS